MSAKKNLLEHFLRNPHKIIDRDTLSDIADAHGWARAIRFLRSEGWQIETLKNGYRLNSLEKIITNKNREPINRRIRYAVLQRDDSTCQRCGRTVKDKIKLEVDHKIPVDWGGKTELDNLWTLCNECNGGKKNLFSDQDDSIMKIVMNEPNGYKRMVKYFELVPNVVIEPITFDIISGIRDWERTLRLIRSKLKMDIEWIRPTKEHPKGGYIYHD